MEKNIAVLATGAIGSTIGADLTLAGHKVLLIDQWPAHVEAMKADGLHITTPVGPYHVPVQAVHLCEVCALRPQFDIVFLAAKSYDTRWLVHFIKPYLKPDGVLVSMQNSLNDEWIAPIIGYERDIGCAHEISAELFTPGLVKRSVYRTHTKMVLGELHGAITPRLREVARILSAVGNVELTTNIWGAKWTKLVLNTMLMGVDTIAGIAPSEFLQDPKRVRLCNTLARESAQVATTLGYTLEPIFGLTAREIETGEGFEKLMVSVVTDHGRGKRSAVQQDYLKGRPSEVCEYLSGLVVKKGREANVPTPANEAVTAVMRQIEQGILEPSFSSLALLDQYM